MKVELDEKRHEPEKFLTTQELAQRLQKTRRTIEIWNEKFDLPRIKIGRSVLYSWPAVVSHLQEKFSR